ncbi:threonine ammonia-lyase [Kutzneria sp. CA-103260]|uniref:threonine ammonia-lyase n=1 Tax=Kutzneria sp. CA-103260 TaxID=2802641 RepID=UPI001BA642C7|nr:threonine/serine dehydratase [Kutzneria sp. CA-103260]QUQ63392.1 threonine dehydratase [Kutzneria sp. CA-103260]
MVDIRDIEAAAERIAGHVLRTPTLPSPGLSALLGAPVTAKLELLQLGGSFKVRGAAAKMLTLTDAERAAGVVAVSGGNHAIAVALMAQALKIHATVVMPKAAPARSVEATRAAGAEVRLTDDVVAAFTLMEELQRDGLTNVHPFADPVVLAGQGTVGLELGEDASELTDVLVSIGGGALISGVAVALTALRPGIRVWGVETEGARTMSDALAAGGPVPTKLSSIVTTLGVPKTAQLPYDIVSTLVTDVLLVSDSEAVQGVVELAEHAKVWAEPAAGCLLPAARRVLDKVGPDARLGLVLCGGNAAFRDVVAWT